MAGSIFLVRHGRYDHLTQRLDKDGLEIDAPKAASTLLAKELGGRALVLSSSAPRAAQTGMIIASSLSARLITSDLIRQGGNRIDGVRDLDELLGRALLEKEVELGKDESLVVVTHAPMLEVVKEMYDPSFTARIGFGEVVEYQAGSWVNPGFRPSVEI